MIIAVSPIVAVLQARRLSRLKRLLKIRDGLVLLLHKYVALIPIAPDLDEMRAVLAKKKQLLNLVT